MRILILEDDQNRIDIFKKNLAGHDVDVVETAKGAIDFLVGFDYDVVFLDHDLGGEQWVDAGNKNTGSEVVRWVTGWYNGEKDDDGRFLYPIAPKSWRGTLFIVHSMNTITAPNMVTDLKSGRCRAERVPFSLLVDKLADFKNA